MIRVRRCSAAGCVAQSCGTLYTYCLIAMCCMVLFDMVVHGIMFDYSIRNFIVPAYSVVSCCGVVLEVLSFL